MLRLALLFLLLFPTVFHATENPRALCDAVLKEMMFTIRGAYYEGRWAKTFTPDQILAFQPAAQAYRDAETGTPVEIPAKRRFVMYQGPHDPLHDVVLAWVPNPANKDSVERRTLVVPKEELEVEGSGNLNTMYEAYLGTAALITLAFQSGEMVRFRSSGRMNLGMIEQGQNLAGEYLNIESDGRSQKVPRESVFKTVPVSKFLQDRPENTLVKPTDYSGSYLDSAAKLSSTEAFRKMETRDQLEILMSFVTKTIKYDSHLRDIVIPHRENLEESICVGKGVCRHQASALTHILIETGFRANMETLIITSPTGETAGHAWVRVEIWNEETWTKKETYYLDPASHRIMTESEAKESAKNSDSPSARWYLNKNKQIWK